MSKLPFIITVESFFDNNNQGSPNLLSFEVKIFKMLVYCKKKNFQQRLYKTKKYNFT